jgi:O-antigen/teichoic acid export membrane protein
MIQRSRKYLAGSGLGPLLIKTVIGSAGLRIAGMFFGFLVGIQLARGLGVEGYGVYGLAMATIALLTVPTEFGLPQLLTREVAAAQVAEDWGRLRGILRWSSNTVLLISAIITIAVMIWLVFVERDLSSSLSKTLVAGLLMVSLVALGKLRGATLLGLQHITKGQLPDTLIRPASFSLLIFLVPWVTVSLTPVIAMSLGVISAACAFGVAFAMLHKHIPPEIHVAIPQIQSRNWWFSALPMALTGAMHVLQGHLVILMLGVMLTDVSMIGIYRVATSVALLVSTPITLFNAVSAPIIARLYAKGDHVKLQRLLSLIALSMFISTLIFTLPFLLMGDVMLSFIFGEKFGNANAPLLVLCGGALISGFFGANVVLLNMTGHQVRITRAFSFSIILLMLVSPFLINLLNLMGAAVATVLSMVVWNTLIWHDARRLLSLDTSFANFKRILL